MKEYKSKEKEPQLQPRYTLKQIVDCDDLSFVRNTCKGLLTLKEYKIFQYLTSTEELKVISEQQNSYQEHLMNKNNYK
ncbi:unnamed protein product [Gordionus sp. m RMFG-2023]